MASTQELKDVIKDTLDNRGVLGQIKARIRAEVFNALDDQSEAKPPLSNENMIINELIREYLEFNRYKYTSSVLVSESGQPKEPLDRDFLAKELNVKQDRHSQSVPLLYGIISHYLKDNKSHHHHQHHHQSHHKTQAGHQGAFFEHLEREMSAETEQQGLIVNGGKR